MEYNIIIEKQGDVYGAYIPDLPGCGVVADTKEEALSLLKEAVQMHIEASTNKE